VIIDVRGLVVRRGGRTILGPLDWQVAEGERWVVLGANGSGKTTLLSAVGLTLWPTAGTVEVLGYRYGKVDSRELRRRIGAASSAVEQELRETLRPVDLVMSAINAATEPWWHEYTDADRARAIDVLDKLGVADAAEQPFGTLSAGERRRVSIARALVPDPDLLLLDEPAASLDLAARETLLADLTRLAASPRPRGIVLVSHHVEEIPPGFDRALVLAGGRAVASGPIEDVVRADVLSAALRLPLLIEHREGRIWARLDGTRAADTRPSHATGTIGS
jgi:iron complex transport system ATP-binding protein